MSRDVENERTLRKCLVFLFICGMVFVIDAWVSERGITCVLHAALWFQKSSSIRQRWCESGSRCRAQMKKSYPSSLQGKREWCNLTKTRLRHGRCQPVSWPMDRQGLAGFIIHRGKFVILWLQTTCGAECPVFPQEMWIAKCFQWESLLISAFAASLTSPASPCLN